MDPKEVIEIMQEWITADRVVFNANNKPVRVKNMIGRSPTNTEHKLFAYLYKDMQDGVSEFKNVQVSGCKVEMMELTQGECRVYMKFRLSVANRYRFHVYVIYYLRKGQDAEIIDLKAIPRDRY